MMLVTIRICLGTKSYRRRSLSPVNNRWYSPVIQYKMLLFHGLRIFTLESSGDAEAEYPI